MNVVLWRLGTAFFTLWDHLPVVSLRKNRDRLVWERDYAKRTIWNALDDLETRGDEVAARSRLYTAMTTVDWS